MVPERQIFNISGPSYLKSVDWNNATHRRCVLASLVQGVYVAEHDRRIGRTGPKSLASTWWHFFHFQLVELLHDTYDGSVIGAVLHLSSSSGNSPKYVIAFRGIIITSLAQTVYKDILLSLRTAYGTLHSSTRFRQAVGRVQHWVEKAGGGPNLWLTGHSLGSAIALLAAKNMAMSGYRLPTFLFNPPFPSAMYERTTDNPKLRQGIHVASSVVKAGLSLYLPNRQSEDQFSVLSDWLPCLFLNPGDPICKGYIGYFEERERMRQIGAGALEDVATKHTLRSLFLSVLDIKSEPRHLLPSAELMITNHQPGPSAPFNVAHGVEQWWNPNLRLSHGIHRYTTTSK